MATTPTPGAATVGAATVAILDATVPVKEGEVAPEAVDVAVKGTLILSVNENGFDKRTPPANNARLTNRGGKGVINVKTTERVGKVVGIAQVDDKSEVMLISHYGKI